MTDLQCYIDELKKMSRKIANIRVGVKKLVAVSKEREALLLSEHHKEEYKLLHAVEWADTRRGCPWCREKPDKNGAIYHSSDCERVAVLDKYQGHHMWTYPKNTPWRKSALLVHSNRKLKPVLDALNKRSWGSYDAHQ